MTTESKQHSPLPFTNDESIIFDAKDRMILIKIDYTDDDGRISEEEHEANLSLLTESANNYGRVKDMLETVCGELALFWKGLETLGLNDYKKYLEDAMGEHMVAAQKLVEDLEKNK